MTAHTKTPWEINGQDIYGCGDNSYVCTWSGTVKDAEYIVLAVNAHEGLMTTIREAMSATNEGYTWSILRDGLLRAEALAAAGEGE
jgi:hypothetical protein